MRIVLVAAFIGLCATDASAQFPGQQFPGQQYIPQYPGGGGYSPINPANVMPNIYNPQTQPLSPYLNLLRGGNAGVNYFYGVRPGTVASGFGQSGSVPFMAGGGNRTLFFPQQSAAPDPLGSDGPDSGGGVLPPAGHPVVFNNTMGYFPSPFGQAGGQRGGLSGLGGGRPGARR